MFSLNSNYLTARLTIKETPLVPTLGRETFDTIASGLFGDMYEDEIPVLLKVGNHYFDAYLDETMNEKVVTVPYGYKGETPKEEIVFIPKEQQFWRELML